MTNVIIIHGTGGSSEGNWFPRLKSKLEDLGCRVFVPKFPTPDGQSLESWLAVFSEYEQYLDENSIVVGHSLGPAFLSTIIEKLDNPIKVAFFVASFLTFLNNPYFDELNKTFIDRKFDWTKIRNNCKKFYLISGDNDPYVPIEKGEEFAKNLDSELILLENAGHINAEFGYTEFEFLLEKIKQEI
ncbi:MAG: alpha/beta hydrolase [Candidatus Gracilibacteria bacterium]|nr:alpha/beta hydrolase [Candidatus Gracilibacteria bacterium]